MCSVVVVDAFCSGRLDKVVDVVVADSMMFTRTETLPLSYLLSSVSVKPVYLTWVSVCDKSQLWIGSSTNVSSRGYFLTRHTKKG